MIRLLWIAFLLVASCSPAIIDVQVSVQENDTTPCLGAAHFELQIVTEAGILPSFHSYGQFFDSDTFSCVNEEFKISDLNFGSGVRILLNLWDSTSDTKGLVATGSSLVFSVEENSPTTRLDIMLSRAEDSQGKKRPLGTLIVADKPARWDSIGAIGRLLFRVIPSGETDPIRSTFFSWMSSMKYDPFPLVVSSLEIGNELIEYQLLIEAQRFNSTTNTWSTIDSWSGSGSLGPNSGQNPGFVVLN